ncbi:hypothetical protein [Rathayibacter sp. VKM Ac-2801]|nr:hypothetical protein [Rathayibacter sp. VKM Ac-2801]
MNADATANLSYRIEPWPGGPEEFRAIFRDGSYGPASAYRRD